ncbi:hypothetical protein B0T16DRAFT_403139 [Cercophora newfieldiana]|uniref:Protein kinase domain-containing protein n=1 Tax=Cercophora newfieldiana TaxID=92897 RepID=A0AA40CTS0_9PEZI|nr:hypothetical protein B0T16DRAFT_403139 [Cercophora newfieldiana]
MSATTAAAQSTADEFREHIQRYIEDRHCYGRRVLDDDSSAEFVPLVALTEFWTTERIHNVLWSAQPRIPNDASHLLEKYIIVLSILVYMKEPGRIDTITNLGIDDANLPITDNLIHGTHDPDAAPFLVSFAKNQWRFCPLTLDSRPYKKQLHPYHIVPITHKEPFDPEAHDQDDVAVYKAEWHRSCLGSLPPTYVVLKEYRKTGPESEAFDMFENEVDIYANLSDNDFTHIVRYYGSFVQNDRFTMILEYASGGTLLEYFKNTPHPSTSSERKNFWMAFFELLAALERIHELGKAKNIVLRGVHQDIRPQNILCFPAPAGSQFPVKFKLADFGSGHVRKVRDRGLDALAAQRVGNGMYSAPEAYCDDNITRAQSSAGDVWSLGAVASEALVWTIKGEVGRNHYQQKRVEVTRGLPNLAGGFHEGSFHDGTCRLDIVEETHSNVLNLTGDDDPVSRIVSNDMILERMLIANPPESFPAKDIIAHWTKYYCAPDVCAGATPHTNSWQTAPETPQTTNRLSMDTPRTRSSRRPGGTAPIQTPSTQYRTEIQGVADDTVTHFSSLQSPTRRGSSRRHSRQQPSFDRWPPRNTFASPSVHLPRQSAEEYKMPMEELYDDTDESLSDTTPEKLDEHTPITTIPPKVSGHHPLHHRTNRHSEPRHQSAPGPIPTPRDHFQPEHRESNGLNIQQNVRSRPMRPFSEPAMQVGDSVQTPTEVARPLPNISQRFSTGTVTTTITREIRNTTINNIYTEFIEKKSGFGAVFKSRDPFLLFPDLKDPLERLKGLGDGRDQYFLVDDSVSMKAHRDEMCRTIRVLAYLLKYGEVDPDKKIELFYTWSTERTSGVKSTLFEKAIKNHVFAKEPREMTVQFDAIASLVLNRKDNNNGASIYILTNGRWNAPPNSPEDLCGVDGVIERLVDSIRKNGREANYVGIQFIRFYDSTHPEDDHGKTRLRYLDEELGKQFRKVAKGDIVDMTDWDGSVRKILLGGILREEDASMEG